MVNGRFFVVYLNIIKYQQNDEFESPLILTRWTQKADQDIIMTPEIQVLAWYMHKHVQFLLGFFILFFYIQMWIHLRYWDCEGKKIHAFKSVNE